MFLAHKNVNKHFGRYGSWCSVGM